MVDSNVQTFVDFRGDLNHKHQPYGIVDALAFCSLAYIDFDMVKDGLPLTLLEAYQIMKENTLYEGKKNLREKDYLLFESMVHQKRYQNIQIVQTKTVLNKETFTQFSAITLYLPDHTLMICYRGTDSTLTGWHENFNMYTNKTLGACDEAIQYLKDAGNIKIKRHMFSYYKHLPMIVAGHSKGGHLALKATINASSLHSRILQVYNFDGPGLKENDRTLTGYKEIMAKTLTVLPEYSFFGRLFVHDEKQVIIESCNEGLAQHELHSWKVMVNGLKEGCVNEQSLQFKDRTDRLVSEIEHENMEVFIEVLFQWFDNMNIDLMMDLKDKDIKQFIDALYHIPNRYIKYKLLVLRLIQMMYQEAKHAKSLI